MAKAKKKDFEKQKLKVGKRKPEKSNATSTAFQTKTLVLPSQMKGPSLQTNLALLRHHQAPIRRQALANIGDVMHLHEQEASEILRSVAPLIVDAEHQVRVAVRHFLGRIGSRVLAPHVMLLIVHVHAAMTHITPGIRADSTQFLDVLLSKTAAEFVRVGFVKTLELYFPLLGWPLEGTTQAGSVSSTLALGKLAGKARAAQLNSLHTLLDAGLREETSGEPIRYHPDTAKFMIPAVGNPFATDMTDDVEARREALGRYDDALRRGLETAAKEGGDIGRTAGRIIAQLS